MVTFEALNALHGDCLLIHYDSEESSAAKPVRKLWLIDGGPKGKAVGGKALSVWKDVLLPRLLELREEHSDGGPLEIALGMVSHIDDDHIFGLEKLTAKLVAEQPTPSVRFATFWFNAFEDVIGLTKPSGVAPAALAAAGIATSAGAPAATLLDHTMAVLRTDVPTAARAASLANTGSPPAALAAALLASLPNALPGLPADGHGEAVLSSVKQGNALATHLRGLGLRKGDADLVVADGRRRPVHGATVTVLGPHPERLEALRAEWRKALTAPTKAARQAALAALVLPGRTLDTSVSNLSSIVALVEIGGHSILLTGDAGSDDIVSAWKDLKLQPPVAPIDILKMPHHGSLRNTTTAFLEFLPAHHYVFSGDGAHDNPDAVVIESLVEAQGKRPITMHFTNGDLKWKQAYTLRKGGEEVRSLSTLIDALRAAYPGPWMVNTRGKTKSGIAIELA